MTPPYFNFHSALIHALNVTGPTRHFCANVNFLLGLCNFVNINRTLPYILVSLSAKSCTRQ